MESELATTSRSNEITVNELLGLVQFTGSDSGVVHRPLPVDDPRRRRPDIGKASRLLGWAPKVALRDGIAETCTWIAADLGCDRDLWNAAADEGGSLAEARRHEAPSRSSAGHALEL